MPGWQQVYEAHKDNNFEILSVAVDGQGPEVVKPFVKDTSFTTVVDENNQLVNLFQFKIVPNGIFIDEEGTIRLLQEGFKVEDPEHVKAIEQLIHKEVEKIEFKTGTPATSKQTSSCNWPKPNSNLAWNTQNKKEMTKH